MARDCRAESQAVDGTGVIGLAVVLTTLSVSGAGPASGAPTARMLPQCQAAQLSLRLDDGPVSEHSTRLTVRNHSVTACRIPGLPAITFRDAGGHVLPIERQIPLGMHPGPVVLPAAVPAGASVNATLGWNTGGIDTGSRCYSPAMIEIAIGEQAISRSFRGRLCGPPATRAKFMQSWFRSNH